MNAAAPSDAKSILLNHYLLNTISRDLFGMTLPGFFIVCCLFATTKISFDGYLNIKEISEISTFYIIVAMAISYPIGFMANEVGDRLCEMNFIFKNGKLATKFNNIYSKIDGEYKNSISYMKLKKSFETLCPSNTESKRHEYFYKDIIREIVPRSIVSGEPGLHYVYVERANILKILSETLLGGLMFVFLYGVLCYNITDYGLNYLFIIILMSALLVVAAFMCCATARSNVAEDELLTALFLTTKIPDGISAKTPAEKSQESEECQT